MKKYSEWTCSGIGFREFVKSGDEIDSEMYDYFLGCVPPIYFHHGFLCGEPSSHRGGEEVYSTFTLFDDKYRYVGEFTENEAKVIGRFLHNVF